MQDRETGKMFEISESEANRIADLNQTIQTETPKRKKIPVFQKGEVVEVKNGRFRIIKLTPLGMILKGVPDTTPLG